MLGITIIVVNFAAACLACWFSFDALERLERRDSRIYGVRAFCLWVSTTVFIFSVAILVTNYFLRGYYD